MPRDGFSHFFSCLPGQGSEEEVGKLCCEAAGHAKRVGCAVELNDEPWVCKSAVRSGNCGATGAAGGYVAKLSRNVFWCNTGEPNPLV